MTWLAALGRFIGGIIAELLPELLKQWRAPRNVQVHGGDREVRDDIAKQIEDDSLRSIGGTRIGPGTQDQAQPPGAPGAANRSGRTGA